MLNAALLWRYFKETFVATRKVNIRVQLAVEIFVGAFKNVKIRKLSLVLLIFISGWGEYFGFIAQFLMRRFHYTSLQTSLFIMVMAVGFSMGFGFLVDYCANRFDLTRCVCLNLVIASFICLLTVLSPVGWFAWVSTVFLGMAVAIAYSLLITLFSNQVNENEQGWVMGVTNAIMALSFGITTFFSGFAANISAGLPIVWAFLAMLISKYLTSSSIIIEINC